VILQDFQRVLQGGVAGVLSSLYGDFCFFFCFIPFFFFIGKKKLKNFVLVFGFFCGCWFFW
jgi:hypothetical protein